MITDRALVQATLASSTTCAPAKGVLSRGGGQRATKKNKQTLVADSTPSLGPDIEKQNNIDFFATRSLMSEARAAIIAVRQMIF